MVLNEYLLATTQLVSNLIKTTKKSKKKIKKKKSSW